MLHESRKYAYCNFTCYKYIFLEWQILAPLDTLTSSTTSRLSSSNHSDEDQMTRFSKDWGMNFKEVRSPLKPLGPARHETQYVNTFWQHKGIRVDYVCSSANDRVVNALHTQHFSWLLISWWVLATGGMKNKFPWQAQTTGSLELKGQLHAHGSWKRKTQNFVISNQLEKKPQHFVIGTPHI